MPPLPSGPPTLLCKDLSVLAKTTPAEASQALVIQALVPLRTHESPSARAVVAAAPASLPFPAPHADSRVHRRQLARDPTSHLPHQALPSPAKQPPHSVPPTPPAGEPDPGAGNQGLAPERRGWRATPAPSLEVRGCGTWLSPSQRDRGVQVPPSQLRQGGPRAPSSKDEALARYSVSREVPRSVLKSEKLLGTLDATPKVPRHTSLT